MRSLCVFISLLVGFYPALAAAFGRSGHQQICQLAYLQAKPATQQHIDALMQFHPANNFAKACAWPDEISNAPALRYTKPHHYINVSRNATTVASQDCAREGCVLSAISHHSALLQSLGHAEQKLQSLLFVSHFVADLHQPLHVSYADDLGGSKTAVYLLKQPTNLHGVWDSGLLHAHGYDHNHRLLQQKFATVAQRKIRSWQQGTPVLWANESLQQTRALYQRYRPGMLLDEQFVQHDGAVLQQRMLQAAVRLAWLLDNLLAAPPADATKSR